MPEPWNAEFAPPRPRYLIGFELGSGRVVHAADADVLVWAQVQLIQVVAATRAAGGAGVVVLVELATGQVCDRITIRASDTPTEKSSSQ